MNNNRSSSRNLGNVPRDDRYTRPSSFRAAFESNSDQERERGDGDRDSAPITLRNILNPIDDTRNDRRLPSLHTVLNNSSRRDTTSPERYWIASRSPKSDRAMLPGEPVPADSHASRKDRSRYDRRCNSPVLAPLRDPESRRYSQPSSQDDSWAPWTAQLSHSRTYPEAGGPNPEQYRQQQQSFSSTSSYRPSQDARSYSTYTSLSVSAPSCYGDPRRDSARVMTSAPQSAAIGAQGGLGTSLEVVGQAEIPGKGLCYVYQDGSICPTVIDDLPVNPAWGTTKAGKPRKRLAQACLPCREKKIRCEPRANGCTQCEKAKRICKMYARPGVSHHTSPELTPARPSSQIQTSEPSPDYSLASFGSSAGGSTGPGSDRSGAGAYDYISGGNTNLGGRPRLGHGYGSTPGHLLTTAISLPDFRRSRDLR